MSDKIDDLLVQLIESHADRVRVLELIAEQRDELRAENERLRTALAAMDQAMAGHPIYETSALQRQVQGLLAKPKYSV
jgi:hypothetical protein